jgi:hypothetical protein
MNDNTKLFQTFQSDPYTLCETELWSLAVDHGQLVAKPMPPNKCAAGRVVPAAGAPHCRTDSAVLVALSQMLQS